jgi:uncharacterized sulfatase
VTETLLLREGRSNPVKYGIEHADEIAKYIDTVNIALLPWEQATTKLIASMNSGDSLVRYWSFVAASSMVASKAELRTTAAADESLIQLAQRSLLDSEPLVAARAAEFLAVIGAADPRGVFVRSVNRSRDEVEALQILNMAAAVHANGQSDYPIDANKLEFSFRIPPKGEIGRRLRHFAETQPKQRGDSENGSAPEK